MWPSLAELQTPSGPVPIGTYGLLVSVAFAAGFGVFASAARRMGVAVGPVMALFCAAALGGLAGARLLYAAAVGGAEALFNCTGGFAFYGGVLGGLGAAVLVTRLLRLPVWKVADAAAPAIVLGHGIGRLGCFFAGCCHGAPLLRPEPATPLLPEGFSGGQLYLHPHFPFLSNAFAGGASRITDVALYPTQLWLSAGSLVLFAVLSVALHHRRFDGQVAALALLLEPPWRAVVEGFRADHRGYVLSWTAPAGDGPVGQAAAGSTLPAGDAVLVGVTTSQGIAIALVALGVLLWWRRRGAGVAPEASLDDAWVDELVG